MKKLYIIRGLPGSGKSSLARQLCVGEWSHCHCEADMYFVDNESGKYNYIADQIGKAHEWCQQTIREAMAADKAVVVVSNTFTRRWEMQIYKDYAWEFGYSVTVVTVDSGLSDAQLAARNVHHVPEAAIARMRARWESYDRYINRSH